MAKKPFDTTTFIEYPKHVYNPANPGEYIVAKGASEVPAGWIDHYPTDEDVEAATKPNGNKPSPLSRDQLLAALKEGNVQFNPRAATKDLEAVLMESLLAVLKKNGTQVSPGTDVLTLLKLAGSKVV